MSLLLCLTAKFDFLQRVKLGEKCSQNGNRHLDDPDDFPLGVTVMSCSCTQRRSLNTPWEPTSVSQTCACFVSCAKLAKIALVPQFFLISFTKILLSFPRVFFFFLLQPAGSLESAREHVSRGHLGFSLLMKIMSTQRQSLSLNVEAIPLVPWTSFPWISKV